MSAAGTFRTGPSSPNPPLEPRHHQPPLRVFAVLQRRSAGPDPPHLAAGHSGTSEKSGEGRAAI
ncbi:putative inactive histone-lysine N-methyltransferase SUVR1 isoform X1 [Iris pallida]|uniref:Inactive histone-lysine N-methyltransferase SUVR1 isoform X1 n=1 Tax=Iris pallida TaxID=29817 RepID=A0AAX6HSU0_IRIPA|nr:putative inactive histone-lysine N-methyltransferase SUVR1 isoform X1 [Iris pallida]KAJ6843637.1 putative inactive histone-lysine N-methyltransferase SUVR1 isoform X1 [Iris pallida]